MRCGSFAACCKVGATDRERCERSGNPLHVSMTRLRICRRGGRRCSICHFLGANGAAISGRRAGRRAVEQPAAQASPELEIHFKVGLGAGPAPEKHAPETAAADWRAQVVGRFTGAHRKGWCLRVQQHSIAAACGVDGARRGDLGLAVCICDRIGTLNGKLECLLTTLFECPQKFRGTAVNLSRKPRLCAVCQPLYGALVKLIAKRGGKLGSRKPQPHVRARLLLIHCLREAKGRNAGFDTQGA